MKQRMIQQLQTGLPWLLVGILATLLWQSSQAGASPSPQTIPSPPQMISYQGVVNVEGMPFNGTGLFKFAIVDSRGGTTYWSNDGRSVDGGEPNSAVSLPVNNGLFNVLLGDTSLPNMTNPLGDNVFAESETYLRIWFDDGLNGFEQLEPDTRIASVAYALRAGYAVNAALLETRVTTLEDKLISLEKKGDDVYITGNLHVINGTGTTDGPPNGLGNIIIGYNEERTYSGAINDRSGSHMLVVGSQNNYSSFGGIVVGVHNETSGAFASVSGGARNTASHINSSVSGGLGNTASGLNASVSGGRENLASGFASSVSGGEWNKASSPNASVSGGSANTASGEASSVSGGGENTASGSSSSISGGGENTASGPSSSISGGGLNTASGSYSSVSGGVFNTASGSSFSSVSGGSGNDAIGFSSSISGGNQNDAAGSNTSVGGGQGNTAYWDYSAVGGGQNLFTTATHQFLP